MKQIFLWLVVVCIGLGATAALAADAAENAKAPVDEDQDTNEPKDLSKFAVDTSFGVSSRHDIMGYGAITFAPFGILDEFGVRLKMEGVNLRYRYQQQGDTENGDPLLLSIQGHNWEIGAALGYEYITERLGIAGFVGIDYQRTTLSRWEPNSASSGTQTGVKFSTDIDYQPIESLSFRVNGSYSTVNNFFFVRARPGFAVMPDVFVGPELTYQDSKFFRQWRIGAHLGQVKLGALAITVTGGFMHDRAIGNGVYGAIETSFRF